ncbi:hypothetical protein EST38_g13095 [Candolleomyces aberdarensis]|uniref:Uncharacterized protein n=1 Tax=Candolleomyces aberdarensis TaxID=2316362 RepID=A0A4V1Q1U0_9AGAR|nr:hypothetical protein EST38_g13095 [Candolleomyces aberdarensis]
MAATFTPLQCDFCSRPGHAQSTCRKFARAQENAHMQAALGGTWKQRQGARKAQETAATIPAAELAGNASAVSDLRDPSSLIQPHADFHSSADTGCTSTMTPTLTGQKYLLLRLPVQSRDIQKLISNGLATSIITFFPLRSPHAPQGRQRNPSLGTSDGHDDDDEHPSHYTDDTDDTLSDRGGKLADDEDVGGSSQMRPGRRPDVVYDATRATNKKLTAVLDEACQEYGLPADLFLRAFLRERDYQKRSDSNWNAFQQWEAKQNKLNGVTEVPPRSEVSIRYDAFKTDNDNWQEILNAFRDVKQIEKASTRTYFLQQRELEKLHEIFEIHAERAHFLNFEVIFAIVGSSIFQNDALNRLYYTPGLKNFSKTRLDVPDSEFLALIMTEACDGVSKPTTRHIKATVVKNRKANKFLGHVDVDQEPEEDEPSETKQASSSITIVTKNKNPPKPSDVVLPSGETIIIAIPKGTHPEKAKYEQNLAFVKGLVDDIIAKGDLRSNTTTIVWARLPGLLAEAGWCLKNYPADIPMPGEIPPGADPQKYIQQGIRVIKRGKLAECVWELARDGSPDWQLVKGDRKLMLENRMPFIIQAPPILSTRQEKRLLTWKKGKSSAAAAGLPSPPPEFGRRLFANNVIDELGPRYVVDDAVCAAKEAAMKVKGGEKGRDDEPNSDNNPKGGGKAKRKAKAKASSPTPSRSPDPWDDDDLSDDPSQSMPPPPHPPQQAPRHPNSSALPPTQVAGHGHSSVSHPTNQPPRGRSMVPPPPPRGNVVAPPPPPRGTSVVPPPPPRGFVPPPRNSIVPPPNPRLGGNTVVLPHQSADAPPARPPSRAIFAAPVAPPPSRVVPVQPPARPASRATPTLAPARPPSRSQPGAHPRHLAPDNRHHQHATHSQTWHQTPVAYSAAHGAGPTSQFAPGVTSRGHPSQHPPLPPAPVSTQPQPYDYSQPRHATSNSSYPWTTPRPIQASQASHYGATDHAVNYSSIGDYSSADDTACYDQGAHYSAIEGTSHYRATDDTAHYDNAVHYDTDQDQSADYGTSDYSYGQASHHLPAIPENNDLLDGSAGSRYQDQDAYE